MLKRPVLLVFLLCAFAAVAAVPLALAVRQAMRPVSLRIASHLSQQQFAAMDAQEKTDYLPTLLPLADKPHYSCSLGIALLAIKDDDADVRAHGHAALLQMIDQMSRIANSRGEALPVSRRQADALNQAVLDGLGDPEQSENRHYFQAIAGILTNPGSFFETYFRSQLGSSDRLVLLDAWTALSLTSEDPYPQYLIDSLQGAMRQTDNEQIRIAALLSASDLADERLLGDIAALLTNDTFEHKSPVRYLALRGLANYGSAAHSVLPLLRSLQAEPDWQGEPSQRLAIAIHRIETNSPREGSLSMMQKIRDSSKIQLW